MVAVARTLGVLLFKEKSKIPGQSCLYYFIQAVETCPLSLDL